MDGGVKQATSYHNTRNKRRRSHDYESGVQNCVLRMCDDKTMELIDLYEKEECLWNTLIPDYKNREERSRAAEKIARILNLPNFEARHVIIKFKNLRNSYCQELKKISHSLNSGAAPEDLYRPKVFWFCKMDSFLRPHLQPTKNALKHQQLIQTEDSVKSESDSKAEWWVQLSNPEDVLNPEVCYDSEPSVTEDECSSSKHTKKRHSSAKKRKEDWSSGEANDIPKMLQDISAQFMNIHKGDDYFDYFGRYIASLLRTMPEQRACFLQPKIISLIINEGYPSDGRVSQSDEVDNS